MWALQAPLKVEIKEMVKIKIRLAKINSFPIKQGSVRFP